jgi:hypothetical protein
MTEKKDEWLTTTERFVGFIDIMGFKDMVARNTHDDIYKMMKTIDEKIKFNANISWGENQAKLIKTSTYSDSITIYSKDASPESLHKFNCTISSLTEDLFAESIPHKGAYSFGIMSLDTDRSIFFGQPLIDAYLLQDELSFYGVIGHASADEAIEGNIKKPPFISRYLCPLKNGNSLQQTIPPMAFLVSKKEAIERADKILEIIDKMRFKTSGHLRKYIDNTELYLKAVRYKTE